MAAERKDVWASGDAYEPYVGRWSRLIARKFVSWLGAPRDREWLDVGCGTGALCEVILQTASPPSVIGIDPSEGFVAFARHKVTDDRARFQLGDAQPLPVPNASFDATVAGLVINFVADQKCRSCDSFGTRLLRSILPPMHSTKVADFLLSPGAVSHTFSGYRA